MGLWAVLQITDGTTSVNLLGAGIRLLEWLPAISEAKGGGVWKDSPLSEGRQLTFRRFGNVIETFKLAISDGSQEAVITSAQNLRRLLEQAISYWMDKSGTVDPVWIEARGECETYSRYALVYDYRTPQDGDPYNGGFVGNPIAFDEWQLLIERGHWLDVAPDDDPTCITLDGTHSGYIYTGSNLVLNPSFETAGGGGADVFLNWTETAGDGTITQDAATYYLGAKSAKLTSGALVNTEIRQDVAVAANSTYIFSIYVYRANTNYGYYTLEGWDGGVPGTWGVAGYFNTPNQGQWDHFSLVINTGPAATSLHIYLICPDTGGAGKVVYYDFVSLRKVTAATLGVQSACSHFYPIEGAACMQNASHKADLTDVFAYDDSAGTYSTNKLAAALPYDIFPNPMAAADIVYFGVDDGALYSGPFSNIVFDLTQAGAGAINGGVWEYWNGAWAALDVADYTRATTPTQTYSPDGPLRATALCGVVFETKSDWVRTTVNGVYGYWVRLRAATISGGVPRPRQQDQQIFTVNTPSVDFLSTAVGGDIPALARHMVYALGQQSGTDFFAGDFILWTRSIDKGSGFIPYLNLSDQQQPTGAEAYISGAILTFGETPQAPTGRAVIYAAGLAGTQSAGIVLSSPLCNSYFGTFRVLLRCKQVGGAANEVNVTLTIDSVSSRQSATVWNTVVTAGGDLGILDFGAFFIPGEQLKTGEDLKEIDFQLSINRTNGAAAFTLYDLILIPIDETIIQANAQGLQSYLLPTRHLEIDSVLTKKTLRGMVYNYVYPPGSYQITHGGAYQLVASRPATFQPNEAQMIGVIFLDDPWPYQVGFDFAYRVNRYLSMRGNR